MGIAEKVNELLNESRPISQKKIDDLLRIVSPSKKAAAACVILRHLDYPNANALKFAYSNPDRRYEKKLLSYVPKEMTDSQATYWMLALGAIKSERAFGRIVHYTKTGLFHQAFLSLASINLPEAMALFDGFLDEKCALYDKRNKTYKHDSGFNTLTRLLHKYVGAGEFVAGYDLSKSENKKALVEDALNCVRESKHQ